MGSGVRGPATIFQVGSVTKVFTALLLADMAEGARFTYPIRPRATFRARRSRAW